MNSKLKKFFKSFIWLGIFLYIVDLVTKLLAMKYSSTLMQEPLILIKGFLRISYVENKSAAFGIGTNNPQTNRIIYTVLALAGFAYIVYFYIKKNKTLKGLEKAALVLIATGAIGNLTDRTFFKFSNHCVVDWIDFYGIWPYVFNIADSCVVIGAAMLIIHLIVSEIKASVKKKKESVNEPKKILSKEEIERLKK